jgi:adenosylcobinamide kinase / adenosylcobinamide-phosphate guanylyltransferase
MKILVTGGARSGKSRHAEQLLADAPVVTYLAPGRPADGTDADWDARVAAHRARRPAHWQTVETAELPAAIAHARGAVLADCLSTWLVALLDGAALWDAPTAQAGEAVAPHLESLCRAVQTTERIVLVTNEVGLGVVPSHRSGVMFRDLLGTVNQRVAEQCDEVHLVIAGRVLRL